MTMNRSLKEKQRREREDLIVQVTQEVLLEQGYHDMSMDEIAARVGIAKGTLYLHFARKEDLVVELFRRRLNDICEVLDQAILMDDTVQQRLLVVLTSMTRSFSEPYAQMMYMIHNSFELKTVIKSRLQPLFQQVSERVAFLIDKGKETGEFDTSIPTSIMVNLFFSILSPNVFRRLTQEKGINPDDVFSHLTRIYFRGIAPSPLPSSD